VNAIARQPPLLVPGRSRLRVKPVDPHFTDAVLRDLLTIRRTSAGRALFRRLREVCRVVTIEKPNPPVDPPNAWTQSRDPTRRGAIEMVVVYDPADWPAKAPHSALPSDAVLFGRLLDAAAMAEGAELPEPTDGAVSPVIAGYLRDRGGAVVPASPAANAQS
jgi:hypothetical protein